MKCPFCDQEHPDEAKFCENTGKELPPVEEVVSPEVELVSEETSTPIQELSDQEPSAAEQSAAQGGPLPEQPPEQAVSLSQMETMRAEPAPTEPLPEEAADEQEAEAPVSPPSTHQRHTRRWLIGGCVGIPVVILLVIVALALIDPFKLHLWGRINGRYDAAAEVMPANTGMYLGINIGNVILTHADQVISPFTTANSSTQTASWSRFLSAPANPARNQQTDPYGDLFKTIEDETGMKFPEDITPWVGQYAGIGVLGFDGTGTESMVPEGMLFAIEVRNLSLADAFLETMMGNMKSLHNLDYSRETYKNVTIYNQYLGAYPSFSYCRSGRMLLGASDVETLKDAIDRQNEQALVVKEEYNQLIGSRSRDWSASLYIGQDVLGSSITEEALGAGALATPLISPYANLGWSGMMLNASVIRQGIRLDMYIGLDTSALSSSEIQEIQAAYTPPTQVIQMLPEDTVIYMANPYFDQVMQGIMSTAFSDEGEKNAFLDSFEEELGFSLQEDLLDHLTGEWALYAVPSMHGLLADQMDLNMAINLLVQTDAELDLQSVTEGLNNLGPYSGIMINSQQQSGTTYYEISSYGDPNPVFAFGAANNYFTLGTDLDSLQLSASNGKSLVNASSYLSAVDTLPNGMKHPIVYADLENLFANLREGMSADEREYFNDSISAIEPISVIAGAVRFVNEDIMKGSIVIILAEK
jgi:hypothetical protein